VDEVTGWKEMVEMGQGSLGQSLDGLRAERESRIAPCARGGVGAGWGQVLQRNTSGLLRYAEAQRLSAQSGAASAVLYAADVSLPPGSHQSHGRASIPIQAASSLLRGELQDCCKCKTWPQDDQCTRELHQRPSRAHGQSPRLGAWRLA
jgi:hypothetical protein